MKLRVGIIGLGEAWETRHRPALRALADRFEVRAVCTEVSQRSEPIAAEFRATIVDGYRALAARPDIDALLVLGTSYFGPLPLLAACDAGKAVYCAASLDIPPHRAEEVKNRVEESGVAFMVEFPRRHAPATLRLKELIATRLGQPRLLFCHSRVPFPAHGPVRMGPNQASGLRDLMELVDWCRYVVGSEPRSVFGVEHALSVAEEKSDYQMMSVDFSPADAPRTGALAQISCGRYMPAQWPEAIAFRPPAALQVACENGIAFIDLPSTLVWFDQAGRQMESLESERPVGEQLLTHFYRAVTSLVRKTSDLEDAYRALRIVLAAHTSCVEGRRVDLESQERLVARGVSDTSLSLLNRARVNAADDAWQRMAELYAPLLRMWLLRFEVPASDADDLVQEVLLTVARELRRFEHSGRVGAFRSWLRTILVNRLRDFWRSRKYRPAATGGSTWAEQLEQLADESSHASREWNLEHDRHVMARLLESVRPRFEPKTWEAFHRQMFGGQRADAVAAELGMPLNSVYVARSRVLSTLRREAAGLIDE